jgi:hypothetical protein
MPDHGIPMPAPGGATSGMVVYSAGVLALTEPGPAATGVVVADERGRALAHRAHYLGRATRAEATAQGLIAAVRMAVDGEFENPVFRVDDAALVDAIEGSGTLPDRAGMLTSVIRDELALLPGHRLEVVSPSANPARAIALAPLVDWLPERTRRAEELQVSRVGAHEYEVASASQPGHAYRVTLGDPGGDGGAEPVRCECSDFYYRGIPCKHLLAVARDAGSLERLFYGEGAESSR